MATMTVEDALFDISLMNAEVKDKSFTDIFIELSNNGIPTYIITRLESLWSITKTIANDIVQVGKIIVLKIYEFIKENSGLAIGIALGAIASQLIGMIPVFGPFLEELTEEIFLFIGGLIGINEEEKNGLLAAAITLAKKFLQLFADIFNAVSDYFKNKK